MPPQFSLDTVVAAEVAASASAIIEQAIPNPSPADVIIHLCGALGCALLDTVELELAVESLHEWQEAMRDVLRRLGEARPNLPKGPRCNA